METEKRLIDAHDLWSDIMMLPHNGDMISSEEVEQAIIEAPTVDAVPVVHAKWGEWWPGDCALIMTGEEMLYQCSACTAKYSDIEGKRYCPHCGAKMDGDGNG